jgi:hypothetical protein
VLITRCSSSPRERAASCCAAHGEAPPAHDRGLAHGVCACCAVLRCAASWHMCCACCAVLCCVLPAAQAWKTVVTQQNCPVAGQHTQHEA